MNTIINGRIQLTIMPNLRDYSYSSGDNQIREDEEFAARLAVVSDLMASLTERFRPMFPDIVPMQIESNLEPWRITLGVSRFAILIARTMTGDGVFMLTSLREDGALDRENSPIILCNYEDFRIWPLAASIDEWIEALEQHGLSDLRRHHRKHFGEWIDQHLASLAHLCAFLVRPAIIGGSFGPDNVTLMRFNEGMLMFGGLSRQIAEERPARAH